MKNALWDVFLRARFSFIVFGHHFLLRHRPAAAAIPRKIMGKEALHRRGAAATFEFEHIGLVQHSGVGRRDKCLKTSGFRHVLRGCFGRGWLRLDGRKHG